MLKLSTTAAQFKGFTDPVQPTLFKLSTNPKLPVALRANRAFVVRKADVPTGFGAYILTNDEQQIHVPSDTRVIGLGPAFDYLREGDVIHVNPSKNLVRVLYRRGSHQNFALVTERCNNNCLMCSQPPKKIDDSWLVDEILDLLPLIDQDTKDIIFTGGEPTLLGDRFIEILERCRSWLPRTAVHILSNGRAFSNPIFAAKFAALKHGDIMVGIPLYSDISERHDYVVQADGAFDETIRGILNLKRLRQRVEIRVVLHRQTVDRLAELASFIARNLRFVDQVALMGLEMTGFTRANLETLWIDPIGYQSALRHAVEILDGARIHTMIYNHQLCVLDPALWRFTRKSISDWKNEYFSECDGCEKRGECGVFFSSAKLRYSDHIRPIRSAQHEANCGDERGT